MVIRKIRQPVKTRTPPKGYMVKKMHADRKKLGKNLNIKSGGRRGT